MCKSEKAWSLFVMICRTESGVEKLLVVMKSLWSLAKKAGRITCSDLPNFPPQIYIFGYIHLCQKSR